MIAAGKEEIRQWFLNGLEEKYKYMIIVFDMMDTDDPDCPYYSFDEDNARRIIREFNDDPMCKVMEVYDLTADMESQLSEKRAWNLPE